jgi:hypothetical protein
MTVEGEAVYDRNEGGLGVARITSEKYSSRG